LVSFARTDHANLIFEEISRGIADSLLFRYFSIVDTGSELIFSKSQKKLIFGPIQ
jgi:hypothetical protein